MRKLMDCRDVPSESACSLMISGEEEEVLRAAAEHAASVHGHVDGPELRAALRASLKDEVPSGGYGTVAICTLQDGNADIRGAVETWDRERHVPGFVREELLVGDDGRTVVTAVFFTSRDAYRQLAQDPAQSEFWDSRIAPLLEGTPRWIDGTWTAPVEAAAQQLPRQASAAEAHTASTATGGSR